MLTIQLSAAIIVLPTIKPAIELRGSDITERFRIKEEYKGYKNDIYGKIY